VLVAAGQREEALAAYQKSLVIRDKLAAADPGNNEWQRDLSVSHDRIGGRFEEQGNLPEALKSYREAFAVNKVLARKDLGRAMAVGFILGCGKNFRRRA
jgi:tetratricopeptide (TPR) repeat protein